ncbi:peptidoglycan D,D-transpeptidase FtsI family protein [Deinococcus maricopensis]|uniref:Peptidoglycan glycosyltransferase n=1 Tax=Deinococcus maricopensis (strain DSM 21211 / LMG 22137 / NRRL B-23946 / LB-34) TaxID=709986 RepID=E8U9I2_DEIML|nr:penicillin-binding protein 2 [Deinococcus maricopensis]ADV67721.1 Peptidoglycan glycosyltransferase [Deinococcus maricopensis DSM 21211]
MEVKIRNRSRLMLVLALASFLFLVYAYAQLEWHLPRTVTAPHAPVRGSIKTMNGTILARSVGQKRMYPQGPLAGQILGMTNMDGGLEGAERVFDEQLSRGEDVVLTIDPGAQAAAESALAKYVPEHRADWGMVVALEVKTGRVLAAATYPPFDPNNWRNYDASVRRNRPFVDTFEPGSPVKGLVVAAAMNEGLTTPTTQYSTPMVRVVGRKAIHDAVDHPGQLTTRQVLRYSSNVGMSHIVEGFDKAKLRDYLYQYGFGRSVDLPDMPTSYYPLQALRRWDDLVRVNNAFGQGMSGSLLQLTAAYNTLANDGMYVSPQLVQGAVQGERREVLRPETARTIRMLLRGVIEDGISRQAGIKGYSLAGKTGTAQVVTEHGYSQTDYNSTFAGFFPAEQPRVTLAVMVHGAKVDYHGSMLAAPIYRDIAGEIIARWAAPPQKSPPEKE